MRSHYKPYSFPVEFLYVLDMDCPECYELRLQGSIHVQPPEPDVGYFSSFNEVDQDFEVVEVLKDGEHFDCDLVVWQSYMDWDWLEQQVAEWQPTGYDDDRF